MVEIIRVMVRNYKGEVNVVAFPKDVLCIEAKGGLRPTSSTQEFGQRLSQRQRRGDGGFGKGGEEGEGGNRRLWPAHHCGAQLLIRRPIYNARPALMFLTN